MTLILVKDSLKNYWDKEKRPITKYSSNKGFSGLSSILPRTNFGVSGQESASQSLTAATLKRYRSP